MEAAGVERESDDQAKSLMALDFWPNSSEINDLRSPLAFTAVPSSRRFSSVFLER